MQNPPTRSVRRKPPRRKFTRVSSGLFSRGVAREPINHLELIRSISLAALTENLSARRNLGGRERQRRSRETAAWLQLGARGGKGAEWVGGREGGREEEENTHGRVLAPRSRTRTSTSSSRDPGDSFDVARRTPTSGTLACHLISRDASLPRLRPLRLFLSRKIRG